MENRRLNFLIELTKYPTYKIVNEIEKLESTEWVDLLISHDILGYNSTFWDHLTNKNEVYSAFWVFVGVFRKHLKNNPYLGKTINNLLKIEINSMSSELILKRTDDICKYIFDNNDLSVVNNYIDFLKELYNFNRAEYVKHMYLFTLYCNKQSVDSRIAESVFEMIIDIIISYRDVNYSGVVSHIFYSKLYLHAKYKTANKLISLMDSAFIYSGYSTWLTKNNLFHEVRITFTGNIVTVFNKTVGNIQQFDIAELKPERHDTDTVIAEGLNYYTKTNGYNEVSKADILMAIRNIKYYGFFDRSFKFSFNEGNMEFYQTIGCLLNFIFGNTNFDFAHININPLIKSQYKFLQAYGLYLTHLSTNQSLFNQLVDNISVLTEIMKNGNLEFYVNSIISKFYTKLDMGRKRLLDDALASLRDHKQINRILNLHKELFEFDFTTIDNVKARTEGSISFGTLIDVPVIELDNLNSLSDDDFIVLINDIDINEEKYKDKNFIDYKVKNAKGTFENLSSHLKNRPRILDSTFIFTPRVLYYNSDILKQLYSVEEHYRYCFLSMSSYYVSNELLSEMAWNIRENHKFFEDNPVISSNLLMFYNQFVSNNTIVYDTLEIDPSKTQYKTWSNGKVYVDILSQYINSNVHNIFDPIYNLVKICKTDFVILKKLLVELHANNNYYWAFTISNYSELFEYYGDIISKKPIDAYAEEILVFGICSSEHRSNKYFNLIKDFVNSNKDYDLISKDDGSFNRGYAFYAVYGYIYNWDKTLLRQYLSKCFYKKASFQNLIDLSFELHNFGNSFLLRESIDCIFDKTKHKSDSFNQLSIDFIHQIIPLLRSITKFNTEVKLLVDNIMNLINQTETYKRLDFVSSISFGIDEYNRSEDEKILIKEIIMKLFIEDFDGFEKQLYDELLQKL